MVVGSGTGDPPGGRSGGAKPFAWNVVPPFAVAEEMLGELATLPATTLKLPLRPLAIGSAKEADDSVRFMTAWEPLKDHNMELLSRATASEVGRALFLTASCAADTFLAVCASPEATLKSLPLITSDANSSAGNFAIVMSTVKPGVLNDSDPALTVRVSGLQETHPLLSVMRSARA